MRIVEEAPLFGLDRQPRPPLAAKPHWQGHRDRLRTKLIERGANALEDYELLETLLFAFIPRRDVKPISKALLARFGSLSGVLAGMGNSPVATCTRNCNSALRFSHCPKVAGTLKGKCPLRSFRGFKRTSLGSCPSVKTRGA